MSLVYPASKDGVSLSEEWVTALNTNNAITTTSALLFGIQLTTYVLCLRMLFFRGFQNSVPHQALAIISSILILSSGIILGVTIYMCQSQLKFLGPINFHYQNDWAFRIYIALGAIIIMLHDAVLIWRAWILVDHKSRIVLGLCFLGVMGSILNACVHAIASKTLERSSMIILQIFMIVTNFITTSMIARKLWLYWTTTSKYIKKHSSERTMAEKIFVQIAIQGVFDYSGMNISILSYSFNIFLIGIHPSLVILLVAQQKSGLVVISDEEMRNTPRNFPQLNSNAETMSNSVDTIVEGQV
ncbi:hypothetical protein K435DRAFT_812632 [Dendrothele bispora CBS 962.96]|uniref:Uncharacterized protein n=1 Tax=Dendrothele bispora (strain CBS 962.96) TaxID=1314807 RepID=A0A4V4HAX6_DENBC|nr:hypothetical protein K435DRAFT_812632 [Dendrothele bispora CBS 962.96]